MTEEQSIKDQIVAMEGWAIKAKQNADAGKYKEAGELLRTLNTQGRRLEWRGGRWGLKHLPELEEVKVLKKKITQARAAAQEGRGSIKNLEKLSKKEGKSPAEVAAIGKKENQYKKETGKSMPILIQVLKEAGGIAQIEPWIDPKALSRPENKDSLYEFLRGEKFYKKLGREEREELIKKIDLSLDRARLRGVRLGRANLEGASLNSACLWGAILNEVNFKKAVLSRADLRGANLCRANLKEAFLADADLSGANLTLAEFEEAYLHGVKFYGADFNGVNLKGVKKLTKEQLHSAKNWQEAENIPKELL